MIKNTDAHTKAAQTTKVLNLATKKKKKNLSKPGAWFVLPQRVHDPPIAPQPQEAVGSGDPVGVRFAGIPEERVGNPDFSYHVTVEHEQLHGAVELQAAVVPRLGKEDVDGVLLEQSLGITCKLNKKNINL